MMNLRSRQTIQTLLVLAALISINILVDRFPAKLDLTEDKKYSLTDATELLIGDQKDPIFIDVLLSGEFPAGFKRLQNATREILSSFRAINPEIIFQFRDPLSGESDKVKSELEELAQVGILPTELNVRTRDGTSKKRVYPYAIFHLADRQIAINLLEQESAGESADESINRAINLLEYKCANAIVKLRADQKPNVMLTTGNGELSNLETVSLVEQLRPFYNTGRVFLDSIYQIPSSIDMVVVARPQEALSDKEVFVLDQFLVRGGNIIFLIDPLQVNLDSIQRRGQYIPHDIETGLDDAFFKYGFRISKNLALDLECSSIPLQVGGTPENPQFQMFNWYYHPLVAGAAEHPITKGIERVNLLFPATIDTIRTKADIRKSSLLQTSSYTRLQQNPVILDFNVLRSEPNPDKFSAGQKTVALLLEGAFISAFENRVTSDMRNMLRSIDAAFVSQDSPGKILVVTDGDLARNTYDVRTGQPRPLGFNPYIKYTFGNAEFLINAIEYMLDRNGLSQSRAKDIQLRLLDRQRLDEEKVKWQVLNLVLPLLLVLLAGIINFLWRKKKYAY